MHKRYHAQRQHIIHSFDALLYQLHTLSFILSPSVWSFLCRVVSQVQCSKPRDLDATASRSLRFFFFNILFFNAPSVWHHATQGAAEGRAVVLDFVGLGYVPSKLHLLGLDLFIIFAQMVLTTIAYEASLFENSTEPDTQDMLLPIPNSPMLSPAPLLETTSRSSTSLPAGISGHTKSYFTTDSSPYVIDLRLAPILGRLRNPAPPPRVISSDTSLPLPNTTPWHLPSGMRMLMRSTQTRRDGSGRVGPSDSSEDGRIPGGLVERDG